MNKKGFTLIELIAVIIILAIIALIATPIIMRVIEKTKESANQRSVSNYIRTIETAIVAKRANGTTVADHAYKVNGDGNICLDSACEDILIVGMSGSKPIGGMVTIQNWKVISALELYLNGEYYSYDNGVIISSDDHQTAGGYTSDNGLITWDEMLSQGYISLNANSTSITGVTQKFKDEIANLVIPSGITSIANAAFSGCSSLKSITIPEGVTTIGLSAFMNCTSLGSILIPETVTNIRQSTFYGCSSLKSVTLPETVTSIELNAFRECSNLESITIPEGVTTIGGAAFKECSNLKSVKLPETITSIEKMAFQNCSSLKSITIPGNVRSIGTSVFYGCTDLKSATFTKTSNWNVYNSETDTSGVNVDVTNPDQNATNLKTTYQNKIWKRIPESN